MNIKDEILRYSKELGLNTVGFVKCRRFEELEEELKYRKSEKIENEFEEKDIDKRINPFSYMEDGKTIISIAFPYRCEDEGYGEVYFSSYTRRLDYHRVVLKYLNRICDFIEKEFKGKAIAMVDSNGLPERYIACLSRIGFIGKNNMVITKEYGSYVFLGEIITDLAMDQYDDEWASKAQDPCGNCDICLKKCPTSAINKIKTMPNRCMSYITQQKDIEEKWIKIMDGRLFGCDDCQRYCPYNLKAKFTNLEEFKTLDFMNNPDIDELIYMDNKLFKERYSNTSCGWRGKALLQRNAIIAKAVKKNNRDIDNKRLTSPKVISCYELIKNL